MRKIMLTQGDKCVGFNLQITPIEMLIINKALEQIKNLDMPDSKVDMAIQALKDEDEMEVPE